MVGRNLVSWKSKQQKKKVVSKSSSEAEYQAMALGTCKLMWVQILLCELGFICKGPMVLHSDSTSVQDSHKSILP